MKFKLLATLLLPLALSACSNTYPDASAAQFEGMVSIEQTWQGQKLTGPEITLAPEVGTTQALFNASVFLYGTESSNAKHQIDTRVNLSVKHTDFGEEYAFVSLNGRVAEPVTAARTTFRTCSELCVFDQMFSVAIPDSTLAAAASSGLVIKLQPSADSKQGAVVLLPAEYVQGYQQARIAVKSAQ